MNIEHELYKGNREIQIVCSSCARPKFVCIKSKKYDDVREFLAISMDRMMFEARLWIYTSPCFPDTALLWNPLITFDSKRGRIELTIGVKPEGETENRVVVSTVLKVTSNLDIEYETDFVAHEIHKWLMKHDYTNGLSNKFDCIIAV